MRNGCCIATESRHRWQSTFRFLDRYPQKGGIRDRVFGSKGPAEINARPESRRTARGGAVTVIQCSLITWYLLLGFQTHILENSDFESSTEPQVNFLPDFALNFTFTFHRATGNTNTSGIGMLSVNDSWLKGRLQTNGLTATQAEEYIQRQSTSQPNNSYTFPLGYGIGGLQTRLEFWIPSEPISEFGLKWTLNSSGVIEGDRTGVSYPALTGDLFAVPATREVCLSYSSDGMFCTERGAAGMFDVPGRHSPSAMYGPDRMMCLEELELDVRTVPLTEVNDGNNADALWQYLHPPYRRQYFTLALADARTVMTYHRARRGNWFWCVPSCRPALGQPRCGPRASRRS